MSLEPFSFGAPRRRPFVARVLRTVLQERWAFAITFTAVLAAGVVGIRTIQPVYEARARVLLEYPRSTEQLTGGDQQVQISRFDVVGERVSPVNNQIALLNSGPTLNKALLSLKGDSTPPRSGSLSVKNLNGTDLIDIAYRTDDPKVAARVVQAVIDVYIQDNLDANRSKSSAARLFLQKRLPEMWNQLQTTQNNLESFQRRYRFLGTTVETDSLARALVELEAQVNRARVELTFSERKLASLQGQLPGNLRQALSVAGVNQELGYQELQRQLLQMDAQIADLQSRYGPENPQLLNALQRRDQLQVLLKARTLELTGTAKAAATVMDPLRQRLVEQEFALEIERKAQAGRLAELQQQLLTLQKRSSQLPQLIKQQAQLQMANDTARQEYMTFKEKYTASRFAEQQNISNVRLIEPPGVNFDPVWPNRKLLLAAILVVGTGGGLLVVWLRHQRREVLDGIIELREALPLPILTSVPWSGNGRIVREERMDQHALISSFRMLQACLRMQPSEVQVVSVCSWAAGEGRSSVLANLGLLEANLGRRVLLIDADGRFPGQPEYWNFDRTIGSAILSRPLAWRDFLHAVSENFAVLPYGDLKPSTNYREWLALIEQLRDHYDLILIDSPPLMNGPDATLLASMSQGVLWVCNPQKIGRKGVEAAAESLRNWSGRLLGQVVIGQDANPPRALPVQRGIGWLPAPPDVVRRWQPGISSGGKSE